MYSFPAGLCPSEILMYFSLATVELILVCQWVEYSWLHVIYCLGRGTKPKRHWLLFTWAFTNFWTSKDMNSLLLNNSFIKTDMNIFLSWVYWEKKTKTFSGFLSGSQSMFGILHFGPSWPHLEAMWLVFTQRGVYASSCGHEGMTKTLGLLWAFSKIFLQTSSSWKPFGMQSLWYLANVNPV